jgi:hypothetical protein
MITENPNNPFSSIADKIEENLVKFELIAVAVTIAGIVMDVADIQAGSIVYAFSMSILAVLYLISVHSPLIQESTAIPVSWKSFLHKITYLGFAVGVTGLLFILSDWPGYNIMLICSGTTLVIVLILLTIAIRKHDAGDEYGQAFWMRFMLITGFCCYALYKIYLPDVLKLL